MLSKDVELLEVSDLSLAFKSNDRFLEILSQINFELKPGKTLGLVGESGCGKSLTSYALMRLLPLTAYYAENAKILLQEQDLLLLEAHQMRQLRGRKIAMVFQEPMLSLNPVRTLYMQLNDVIAAHQNLSDEARHQRIITLMQDVEIDGPEEKLQQYPHQWSGGQKQRFLIAMALANMPDILIADEPTTALDIFVQEQILTLLKKLQAKYGLSILMISHNLKVIESMADEVMIMYLGEIVESSDAQSFWQQPLHPYVHQLIHAVPNFSKRLNQLPSIPGKVPSFEELPSGCRFHPRCQFAMEICQTKSPSWHHASQSHEVRCHLYPRENPIEGGTTIKPIPLPAKIMSGQKILRIQNLYLQAFSRFASKKTRLKSPYILKGVDLELYQGETLSIVGQSGCGKTTLAQTIMGLNPHYTGELDYLGLDIRDFQMVFQDPAAAMNPRWTIAEILSEACSDEAECLKMLEAVHMSQSVMNHYPHELSGGQRQRVCIARALLAKPKVLICDEPTSALDISVQAQILNLLKSLQAQFSLTYIFISHDLDVVAFMADKVAIMQDGHFVEQGPIEQIWQNPQHEYTQFILSLARG